MTVVWSRRAIDHLVALREYIAEDSPRSAGRVARQILDAAELLTTQPHIGRPGRITGTRELVIAGTPYVIPYRVLGTARGVPRATDVAAQSLVRAPSRRSAASPAPAPISKLPAMRLVHLA